MSVISPEEARERGFKYVCRKCGSFYPELPRNEEFEIVCHECGKRGKYLFRELSNPRKT
ncbi:MAG: hypothetical protein NTW50_00880 [Candidatus Berkelbacteria bacterium]|nr:hypothetical protein [Candidatus Berkelbacteria bacterium]